MAPAWKVLWMDADARTALHAVQEGQQLGLHVVLARNTEEAHAALNRQTFDAEVYAVHSGADDPGHLVRISRDSYPSPSRFRVWILDEDSVWERLAASREGVDRVFGQPAVPASVAREVADALAERDRPRPRVLLLEDDILTRSLLVETLQNDRMDVDTLDDLESLLPFLDEHGPDLVLVDPDLPRLAGLDLCRVLRGHPRWRRLRIVFYAVQVGPIQRLGAWQAGVDDFIPKPCRPEEILLRLRRCLSRP